MNKDNRIKHHKTDVSQKSVIWRRNSPWCWQISLCESLLSFNNRQGQSEHCLPLIAHFIFCLKSNLSVDGEHGRQIKSVVFEPRAKRSKLVSHTAPQRGRETRGSRQLQLQVISSTLTSSRRLTVGGQQLPQTITNHHWGQTTVINYLYFCRSSSHLTDTRLKWRNVTNRKLI